MTLNIPDRQELQLPARVNRGIYYFIPEVPLNKLFVEKQHELTGSRLHRQVNPGTVEGTVPRKTVFPHRF